VEQSKLHYWEACPLCGSRSFVPFLKCKDFTVSGEKFQIVSCSSCSFKFTNPVPGPGSIGEYYKSEDYISHSSTKKGLVSWLYQVVRKYTLKRKLALIRRCSGKEKGVILDYGCGTGHFLSVCHGEGWESFGVEPDPGARSMVPSTVPVVPSIAELEGTRIFDVITLWHVLEHVFDLHGTLDYFKKHLAKEGVIFVAVPNHRSADALNYGQEWAAYDVPRHLYHFDQATMKRLMQGHGFRLEETLPMPFDSYYVSMLSEKYAQGKISYLRAFLAGYRSNAMAKKSGEASSLIYVLRHA
jgi:SAM-dependent methyltransferase